MTMSTKLTQPGAVKLIVLLGVLAVSGSAILIRLSAVHYVAAATYRMLFTVGLMAPTMMYRMRRRPAAVAEPPMDGAARFWCIVGGVFLALHFGFWFKSLQLTSVSTATVLVNTHPLFVMLLGMVVLREKVPAAAAIWMLVAMAGSAGLALGGTGFGESALEGNLMAIAGAMFVSVYMVIGRYARRSVSLLRYTFLVYLAAASTLLLYALASGVDLGPYPPREYVIFLAMAVFPTLLGHSVFNWALKYLKMSFVSTAILGEPVFATILAIFIFVEIPGPWTVLFGALVIFAIYRFTVADNES
ncbi:MAG: DMT family transporter [Spirochaetaceae bacterium]|nr:MAG: DMT family transporter [Spirochaetaceae bacterium]